MTEGPPEGWAEHVRHIDVDGIRWAPSDCLVCASIHVLRQLSKSAAAIREAAKADPWNQALAQPDVSAPPATPQQSITVPPRVWVPLLPYGAAMAVYHEGDTDRQLTINENTVTFVDGGVWLTRKLLANAVTKHHVSLACGQTTTSDLATRLEANARRA